MSTCNSQGSATPSAPRAWTDEEDGILVALHKSVAHEKGPKWEGITQKFNAHFKKQPKRSYDSCKGRFYNLHHRDRSRGELRRLSVVSDAS
jgi:hypothetical protein